jgi:hypothetical protein
MAINEKESERTVGDGGGGGGWGEEKKGDSRKLK